MLKNEVRHVLSYLRGSRGGREVLVSEGVLGGRGEGFFQRGGWEMGGEEAM
jgi:hypothetical protein